MDRSLFFRMQVLLLAGMLAAGLGGAMGGAAVLRAQEAPRLADEPIRPVPRDETLNPEKVALGGRLFSDVRLSRDGTVSCAHCHTLDQGGVDGARVSVGVAGAEGGINAPTVFNSRFSLAQFWDGRAETLEDQVGGPLTNPVEMAFTWPEALAILKADDDYVRSFDSLYQDGITQANVRDAIAEFERSLVTLDAPFDRYLRGETDAISPQAQQGYRLFKDLGCASCHQGIAVGGNMFQTMGVFGDYFADRGQETEADRGREAITGRPEDRHVFKVPSLRLVAQTAPYFHDGRTMTLEEAVQIMARYQLGRELDGNQVSDLVAFLETLAGSHPKLAP